MKNLLFLIDEKIYDSLKLFLFSLFLLFLKVINSNSHSILCDCFVLTFDKLEIESYSFSNLLK